jgi:ABC-type nitrate/sulfonate/bicarbonate transport system substrate-binding protein
MKRAKRAKFVTSRAEEYWRYAQQCLEIAPTFQDKEARATVLGFARAWLRLAHLAQANRQIAELAVQIATQRIIVKHAVDTGQRSEMAESLLDALEGSLRMFEKHRIFLLSCNGSSSALPPGDAATGRSLSRRNGHGAP